jgi:RNA polymerase sigma-70 factor (ECF subfamily)
MPHVASLFRIARWLTRNQTDAEDLLQETLLEALRSFDRFTQGTNCRAWLVSIIYHHQSKKRRAAIHLLLVSAAEERAETIACEAPAPQNLTDEEVLSALRRIPRTFQEVVVLADVEGLNYKEIAAATQIPIGTLMSRISRGRKLLRSELVAYARAHGFGGAA